MFVPDLTPTFYGAVSTGESPTGLSLWLEIATAVKSPKGWVWGFLRLKQRAGGGFWCSHVRHRLAGPVGALADRERAGIRQSWFGASCGVGDPRGRGVGLNRAKELKASRSPAPGVWHAPGGLEKPSWGRAGCRASAPSLGLELPKIIIKKKKKALFL